MQKQNNNLNLARKWRPKNFDQIVGQEISVRMLKNGLFLKKLFPVYLFAGLRGCGKTSTARIFASAINCQNLEKFQENPSTHKIPCLECESCKSMHKTNHPDFIEIDAASHTGVENVRQILESCAYMPILGTKKIYLIDEAHMLSKAAFNAFLKILEEPPASALFILATTEIQKFPETVLSRCFQVIFKSVSNNALKKHLQQMCKEEDIKITDQAINLLIQETEGSVRDAINLLERVRFSEKEITLDSLLNVLGKISEKELFDLFETVLEQDARNLLNKLSSTSFENINPQNLWNMFVQLCRTLMWIKFNAEKLPAYFNNLERLKKISTKCTMNRLNAIFQLLWSQEELFLKTPQKQIFLEGVLLQICQQTNVLDLKELLDAVKNNGSNLPTSKNFNTTEKQLPKQSIASQQDNNSQQIASVSVKNAPVSAENKQWQSFLSEINKIDDQFLLSIFNQIKFIKEDKEKKLVNISLQNDSSFFRDKISDSKEIWMPIFKQSFPECDQFHFVTVKPPSTMLRTGFENVSTQTTTAVDKSMADRQSEKSIKLSPAPNRNFSTTVVNISDKEKWPMANLIAKHFPGKIKRGKND